MNISSSTEALRNAPGTCTDERSKCSSYPTFASVILGSVFLTLLQTAICILVVDPPLRPHGSAYHELAANFDSNYYASIVESGYAHSSKTKTYITGFFPGFPLLAWPISYVFNNDAQYSLAFAAQCACVGMWIYVFLFLRRWKVSTASSFICILAILSAPSSFFFILGYSESLFVFSLIGAIYWLTEPKGPNWFLASIHGFVLSATRLVGLPLVVLPIVIAIASCVRRTSQWKNLSLWISAVSSALVFSLGALLFFAYCHFAFGHWDLYFISQTVEWTKNPSIWYLFNPHIYTMVLPRIDRIDSFIFDCNLATITYLTAGIVCLFVLEQWIRSKPIPSLLHERIPFYASAGILLIITIVANGQPVNDTLYFPSMLRYGLPVYVLLLLGFTHVSTCITVHAHWLKRGLILAAIVACFGSLGLELFLNILFQEARYFIA